MKIKQKKYYLLLLTSLEQHNIQLLLETKTLVKGICDIVKTLDNYSSLLRLRTPNGKHCT